MYSLKSYRLLKCEYNYLLPVLRKNLSIPLIENVEE